MAAKYLNMKTIIGVDIYDHKLPLAKELGCTDVLNSKNAPDGDIVSIGTDKSRHRTIVLTRFVGQSDQRPDRRHWSRLRN